MVKNIYFDMGGIVFRQNTSEAKRRFRDLGINPDEYMGAFGQKEFFLDVETGAIDGDEFCRKLSEVVGRRIGWDEAQHCWLGFLDNVPEAGLEVLEELRKKYHIGLLSNTNPFIMDYMRSDRFCIHQKGIQEYFDVLHCSYEMGVCKPSPEIFLKALEEDGFMAEETVFVDDSLKNIEAAERVGIKGLYVPTNEQWATPLFSLLG